MLPNMLKSETTDMDIYPLCTYLQWLCVCLDRFQRPVLYAGDHSWQSGSQGATWGQRLVWWGGRSTWKEECTEEVFTEFQTEKRKDSSRLDPSSIHKNHVCQTQYAESSVEWALSLVSLLVHCFMFVHCVLFEYFTRRICFLSPCTWQVSCMYVVDTWYTFYPGIFFAYHIVFHIVFQHHIQGLQRKIVPSDISQLDLNTYFMYLGPVSLSAGKFTS